MHELVGGVIRKGQQRMFQLGTQPCGDRGAPILPERREPRLRVGHAADQRKMRIGRGRWQDRGAPDARRDEGRELLGTARDRDNGQVDLEALGVGVQKKPRPHREPIAAVARHDGRDEQSGWTSVACCVRHDAG